MAAAAAGHGFFYPSMWGSSHGSGSFTNPTGTSNGTANPSSTSVSQLPNMSPTSTSNVKENRDNNSYEPPHASPPISASSSSPYGYPSSPSKCDVKSVHNIKSEHNFSNRSEASENYKTHEPRKSLGEAEDVNYGNRTEESPAGGYSPNNNNHFDSDKDEMPNTHNSADGGYESTNRHPNYHFNPQNTSTSAYSGHAISGSGNTSSGHLMKRPEGTNRSNTHEKGEARRNNSDSFSPIPNNRPTSPSAYNSSSLSSAGGAYPYIGSAHHQSSPHQTSNLSSPLYGAYSTCGSLFASSKTYHNSSSSSKNKSIKGKPNSSGKNKEQNMFEFGKLNILRWKLPSISWLTIIA